MARRLHIPNKTKICGQPVTTAFVRDLGDNGCFGRFNQTKQRIEIDRDLSVEMQEETWVHEVVEAINLAAELRLSHRTIQTLAAMLHQALTA